jgi:hypothetical protein
MSGVPRANGVNGLSGLGEAGIGSTLWLDPAAITAKISPVSDLHGIVAGEWDRERVFPLATAMKHRSIAQRYRGGVPWEKTDLFRAYARRLAAGDHVRGARTMEQLLAQYYSRVDGMFADMEARGFVLGEGRHAYPLPALLIGRPSAELGTGAVVFIGNQGNHRLAMAQVLGLKQFAGKVSCRHPLAGAGGQAASQHATDCRSAAGS